MHEECSNLSKRESPPSVGSVISLVTASIMIPRGIKGMKHLIALLILLPTSIVAALAGDSPQLQPSNPHGGESCSSCHVAAESVLRKSSTSSSAKKRMKRGLDGVCTHCHAVDRGHGVGKKPELNREKLPLHKGRITCATTCHNMHGNSDDPQQSRFYLRLPMDRLCSSCHDK